MWVRASRLRPGCRRAPASTGEASFRTSGGEIGGCVGADHRIPVAHGDAGDPAGAVDRQVRLGLELGGVVGDIDDPSTTVPVLDGGFDPLQIVLGAARRFDLASPAERAAIQVAR